MTIAFMAAEDISLGMGYVMSYLRQQGHDVKLFFDPRQYARGYAQVGWLARIFSIENYNIARIKKYKPDIVAIGCVTATYQWALRMAKRIKQEVGCKIIMGGLHPTLAPEEVSKHKFIDEVVVGCGVKHFGGTLDPDKIFPDRESFYKELPPVHREHPLFMTGFGCPYACSFCNSEQLKKAGNHILKRSKEGCIKELKELKQGGAKYILFVDDIFTASKNWLKDFLDLYRQEINLPFCCFGHVKHIDKDIVDELKASKCEAVWVGIQSGAEELRRSVLNRTETNKEIYDACKLIKDAGLKLMVDHIFGIPYEHNMTQDASFAMYTEIKADIVSCYQLLYFPKSSIIDKAVQYGYLSPNDVGRINRGEGITYQQDNRPNLFRDIYMKSFVVVPLKSVIWELFPMWLVKVLIFIKARRTFIITVIIQNEIYFTLRAILKKMRLI